MTPLAAVYRPGRLGLSFELFPPKTADGEAAVYRHVAKLMQLAPDFITCTYGGGGSTRDKTLDVVAQVKQRFAIPVASHLTCVGATVEQLCAYLAEADRHGTDYIVALRGDPPRGQTEITPTAGGLAYGNELVALIHQRFPGFGIAVAGYPETHQEATSPAADLAYLKQKVEAGADVVITQLFYDNADFFAFRDRYQRSGIEVPLVPGIMPITNLKQIERIASLCGARLPDHLTTRLAERDDPEWHFQAGVEFATRQVQELIAGGVPGLHFYVLNQSRATSAILHEVER